MKNFRLTIILFTIGMAIFFNIERLDLGAENLIDLDTMVYVLGLIVVVAIIGLPWLHHLNVSTIILLGASLFLVVKLFLWFFLNGRPLLGGIYTYLTFTEGTLLLIGAWLARKLAGGLSEFEDAVKKITFTSNNRRIRQLEEATEEIQAEMFRSRHYHHPLSVIMVEPESESVQNTLHRAVQEVQKSMMNSYIVNTMAQTLSQYLRQTDLILEQREQGRFLILCPDTNSQDLDLLVEYIKTVATEQLGTAVTCGMSTFPDQAITFEELVNQAEAKLASPNGNGDMGT